VKPGNRVEEKTLTTETQRGESLEAVPRARPDGKWTMVELGTRRATERARSGNSPPTVTVTLESSDRYGQQEYSDDGEDSDAQRTPPGCGKSWTRGEDDDVGEST
jgi:hypothetical protein